MELNSSKDKIIFLPKTELTKPLSEHAKYIQDLAEHDPENPGKFRNKNFIFKNAN